MPSPMTKAAYAQLAGVDLHKLVIEVGKERTPEYPLFMNAGPMPWNPITERNMTGFGAMGTKPEGTAFKTDSAIVGGTVSYDAVSYGMAAEFTFENWRDENYGAFREICGEMVRAARLRKEVVGHGPINDAFSGTFFTGFDGVQLCSTAHTRLDGGANMSNRPSPDIGFSDTAVQEIMLLAHRAVNHRGFTEVLSPVQFLLGPINYKAAREVLGSSGRPYSADNEINALVEEQHSWMIDHYLTTEANWFALAAKGVHDMWMYTRTDIIDDAFDDPWTKNTVFSLFMSIVAGFGRFQGVWGSTG